MRWYGNRFANLLSHEFSFREWWRADHSLALVEHIWCTYLNANMSAMQAPMPRTNSTKLSSETENTLDWNCSVSEFFAVLTNAKSSPANYPFQHVVERDLIFKIKFKSPEYVSECINNCILFSSGSCLDNWYLSLSRTFQSNDEKWAHRGKDLVSYK